MHDLEKAEQAVASQRAALAKSVAALTAMVAPDRVAREVSQIAQAYGAEAGRHVWASARRNPAALALVGAGVSLLLTGTGTRPERSRAPKQDDFKTRVAAADAAMKQEMTGMSDDTQNAARMRAGSEDGLDSLPEAARARVLKARRAALSAQDKVEAYTRRAAARTRTFHHQQPLAVGALALGLGALIGALLPATRREDEILGRERDALMRKAQQALETEMGKLAAGADRAVKTALGATSGPSA